MAKLAGKSVVTINKLSVDHDTRAHAGAEGDDDEVLHTASHAIGHLADGCCIGVVGHCHGDATETLGEHLGEWNDTLAPNEVGSVLDVASVVICVGCADTHGLDFFNATHLVDDNLQSLDGCIDVFLTCLITLGLDGSCGLDVATAVNDTENGVSSSQIQANHVGLDS